ncbi:MAG: glycoside hydrolase family protein [Rubrivivax sp.]|nr:glycoside hydrolase family protein [Rubrivivax sp.]
MPAPLRDVPQEGIELIKSFEGIPDGDPSTVNIDAYLCPASVWTIGWGHALVDGGAQLKGPENKVRARSLYPGGITREQAEALLRGDLIPRAASVSNLVKVALDDGPFGALMALVFNIGVGNLAASTLLRKLNAGDLQGAAEQFLAWDKARVNGVLQSLAGLTRRRRAERAMFLGQDWRSAAVTRSREALGVLPVPEMPAEDAAALKQPAARKGVAKRPAAKKPAVKKPIAKKAVVKKAATKKTATKKVAAKKAAPKPRGRTTTATAPSPARQARRPARKAAP